jgi:hypothetical protein
MSTDRDLYVRLAVIKAVQGAVKDAEEQVKVALADGVMDPKDRKSVRVEDRELGTVYWTEKHAHAEVTDRAAFIAFVVEHAPTEVVQPVTLDARDVQYAFETEENAARAGRPHAYERVMRAVERAKPMVRQSYEKVLLDRATRDGGLFDPDTGEAVDCVVVHGAEPGYIAVKQSDKHKQTVADLIGEGRFTLAEVVTPLEIEPPKGDTE